MQQLLLRFQTCVWHRRFTWDNVQFFQQHNIPFPTSWITAHSIAQTQDGAHVLHLPRVSTNEGMVEAALMVSGPNEAGRSSMELYHTMLERVGEDGHINVIHQLVPRIGQEWMSLTWSAAYMQSVLLLEYMPTTLESAIQRLAPTAQELFELESALVSAISFLHDRGLIHTDVSPDNIGLRTTSRPFSAKHVVLLDLESALTLRPDGYTCGGHVGKPPFQPVSSHRTDEGRVYPDGDYESILFVIEWCRHGGALGWENDDDEEIVRKKRQFLTEQL